MPTIWGFDNVENKCGRDFVVFFFFYFFKRTQKNITDFEKKKNVDVNKRRIRHKSMLYLWKNNPKVY